jgi:hypothetical protein
MQIWSYPKVLTGVWVLMGRLKKAGGGLRAVYVVLAIEFLERVGYIEGGGGGVWWRRE